MKSSQIDGTYMDKMRWVDFVGQLVHLT